MGRDSSIGRSKKVPKKDDVKKNKVIDFPIIGIGSSAGGLEALELFLKNVPSESGMAFVIVQHLDPTHKGMMVELLQRITAMPVVEVTDRIIVKPDNVYVIPPNHNMSILHGVLHLLDMVMPRGLRLPIDFFFRSMAVDLQENAIGVILSGMGSDGTLGLRAIKEQGGVVFVQDPTSAKFDGMPRSAIDHGLADVIAPVEELPQKIQAYLNHFPHIITRHTVVIEESTQSALEKIVILLRIHTGHDFSLYKKSTMYRRIERRMGIQQIHKITDYVRFLQDNPHETELLFKELLIGVTSFFRDPQSWESLKRMVIPSIIAAKASGSVVRAWVAGCSTGEEAYSLAMVFLEVITSLKPAGNLKMQIFATDLDKDAIEKARRGVYLSNITADVSPGRLQLFFEQDNQRYRIKREIRETIVFASHNVAMDPPFTKVDIIVCRNLLIYMEQELQKKILSLFHYSLNPGGVLFLGSAESVGNVNHLFETIDNKMRLFRKIHQSLRTASIHFPTLLPYPIQKTSETPELQLKSTFSEHNMKSIIDNLLLQDYAPATLLTNDKGDIIYISGRTGKYLEPAAGKANMNVIAMAREGLRYELNSLLSSVVQKKGELTKKGLIVGTNGGRQFVDVTVKLLETPESLKGMVLFVFRDIAKETKLKAGHPQSSKKEYGSTTASLQEELIQAKDENVAILEEMQTSEEELKSANEELQSANEELQSTNEELTTSKEEMQSLNEELQTVNQELQTKVSDLSTASNDMKNLLNSTDIATLFLDDELNIRRFTTRTASFIKLIASDVGRPVTDIVTDLDYPDLIEDAHQVLHTLVFTEKQISATNGRWFLVKIMPYRTQDNRIIGLVITFEDITVAKQLEHTLREHKESFRLLFETMPVGTTLLDSNGKIVMANPEAERITGIALKDMQGETISELPWKLMRPDGTAFPPEEHPAVIALRSGISVSGVVLRVVQSSGKHLWIKVSAVPLIRDGENQPDQIYMMFFEIAEPRQ